MVALGPLEPKTKEKLNLGRNRFRRRPIEILVHIPHNSNSENYSQKLLYLVKVFKPPQMKVDIYVNSNNKGGH